MIAQVLHGCEALVSEIDLTRPSYFGCVYFTGESKGCGGVMNSVEAKEWNITVEEKRKKSPR